MVLKNLNNSLLIHINAIPMRMAKIQMRQPHDVEHPSPRKSTIHPKIFSPQPSKLKARIPTIMIAMMPRISI